MRAAVTSALSAPVDEAELLRRARDLAGRTVGELGSELEREVPVDQRRAKGLTGSLVEHWLGASAGSRAEPDFPELGIELKTIPLDARGEPRESTFVCSIDLGAASEVAWLSSRARKKLARVLWIPVEAGPVLPLPQRRFGIAQLWSPSLAEDAQLEADWTELTMRIAQGDVDQLSAHIGTWLQVRPKAADGKARRRALDENAAPISALPRGFYLRTQFTRRLFAG